MSSKRKPGEAYSSSSSLSMLSMAESVSWYTSLLLALIMAMSLCQREEFPGVEMEEVYSYATRVHCWNDGATRRKACDEIYVVGEGETLQSIGDKCGDPYIVENNPHIHDPDDVFPGLLIKIMPV